MQVVGGDRFGSGAGELDYRGRGIEAGCSQAVGEFLAVEFAEVAVAAFAAAAVAVLDGRGVSEAAVAFRAVVPRNTLSQITAPVEDHLPAPFEFFVDDP